MKDAVRIPVKLLIVWPLWALVLLFSAPFIYLKDRRKRRKGIKPSILWGPVPLINIKYCSESVRLYGYNSKTLVGHYYHINKRDDFDYVMSDYRGFLRDILPYIVFVWAVWNFNIFQFFFDGGYLASTSLKKIELPLLKLLGKKIIASPYGGDVTIPSRVKNRYGWGKAVETSYPGTDEKRISGDIRYVSRYADFILLGGFMADFIGRYDLAIGSYIPFDLKSWEPSYSSAGDGKVKIVHATNHRIIAGTRYLQDACEDLKKEGYDIELIIIERVPLDRAVEIYKTADIIADQLLGGDYGLFAIEGMALGKPVVCYLREDLFEMYGKWAECPIVNTNIDNLKEKLTTLIESPELRLELGKKGRAYVEKYHSYEHIGGIFDKIFRKIWFGEKVDLDF